MGVVSTFVISIFAVFVSVNSFAGQWAKACSGHGKRGQALCKAAQAELAAKDAARSAAQGGKNINVNAGRLAADAAAQKADVATAKAKCDEAQKECEDACKGEEAEAKPIAQQQPPGPKTPEAKLDVGGLIKQATQKDCKAPIEAQKKLLDKAGNNLGNDKNAADKTDQASNQGGGPPPIPPITPPPPKEKEEKKEAEKLSCEGDEGARYSDCNSKYASQCNDRMNESGCETFANRYCGAANSGTSVKNFVADKGGEGLGSDFCKMVTAYKFCKAVGRTECPSCRGSAAHSSSECQANPTKCVSAEQLADAKNKCPTDPIFLDPNLGKTPDNGEKAGTETKNNEPTTGKSTPVIGGSGSAGGGSGGSGGGSGLGGGAAAPILPGNGVNGATPESLPGGLANALQTGGSGSGGNYGQESTTEESEENREPATTNGTFKEGILPAGAVEGSPAQDVSNRYGPNLFSISSDVYRSMCAAEKLSSCVRRKK